jgi:hypothetical protein
MRLSAPRWVVARVRAPRRVSDTSAAAASAAPSAGSVPLPTSSSRTREPSSASSRISRSSVRWALKVDRLAAMDCRSPMSEKMRRQTGSALPGPTGGMIPLWASATCSPTALSSTDFPPVLGPERRMVRSPSAMVRSKGTTTGGAAERPLAGSAASSRGWRPRTIRTSAGAVTTTGAWPSTSAAHRARATRSSTATHIWCSARSSATWGRSPSLRSRRTLSSSRVARASASRSALPSPITAAGSR